MNTTIFTRGLANQMENWKVGIPAGDTSFMALMRNVSVSNNDGRSPFFFRRTINYVPINFLRLTEEESRDYENFVTPVLDITGAPRHLGLYLYLTSRNKFDHFLNAYKGATNEQSANAS